MLARAGGLVIRSGMVRFEFGSRDKGNPRVSKCRIISTRTLSRLARNTVFRGDRGPECRQSRIARSFQRMKLRFWFGCWLRFRLLDNYYRTSNETKRPVGLWANLAVVVNRINRKFTSRPSAATLETHVRNAFPVDFVCLWIKNWLGGHGDFSRMFPARHVK